MHAFVPLKNVDLRLHKMVELHAEYCTLRGNIQLQQCMFASHGRHSRVHLSSVQLTRMMYWNTTVKRIYQRLLLTVLSRGAKTLSIAHNLLPTRKIHRANRRQCFRSFVSVNYRWNRKKLASFDKCRRLSRKRYCYCWSLIG